MEEVVDAYDRLIDNAVQTTVDRHRAGANEETVLAETLIAVRAAQAVESLTGVEWDKQLESRVGELRESSAEASPVTSATD